MLEQSLDAYEGGYDPERYRQTDSWWTGRSNDEEGEDIGDDDE